MKIYNKYLNISTEDVSKQTDINILYQWLLDIQDNLISMDITIEKAGELDNEWIQRVKSARRLQGQLKQRIQFKINELKKEPSFAEIFMEQSRLLLDEVTFELILNKTKSYGNTD